MIRFLKKQTDIKDFVLIIKLHPTDNIKRYKRLFKHNRDIPIVVTNKINIQNLITMTLKMCTFNS